MVRNRLNAAHTFPGIDSGEGSGHLNSGTKFALAGVAALAITTPLVLSPPSAVAAGHAQIKHVLLISVDGMHQSDLDWYVATHPNSELARLATGGREYTDAQTADPSDSDPGGTALMTGGDPKVT
ncbi:MAG: alkaline phosphatase family protein, partial [Streptosporangiaceae bacterium]